MMPHYLFAVPLPVVCREYLARCPKAKVLRVGRKACSPHYCLMPDCHLDDIDDVFCRLVHSISLHQARKRKIGRDRVLQNSGHSSWAHMIDMRHVVLILVISSHGRQRLWLVMPTTNLIWSTVLSIAAESPDWLAIVESWDRYRYRYRYII